MTDTTAAPEWLTQKAVADRIGVSEQTVGRMAQEGRISFVQFRRRRLIPESEVRRLLAESFR